LTTISFSILATDLISRGTVEFKYTVHQNILLPNCGVMRL